MLVGPPEPEIAKNVCDGFRKTAEVIWGRLVTMVAVVWTMLVAKPLLETVKL